MKVKKVIELMEISTCSLAAIKEFSANFRFISKAASSI